MTSTRRPEYTTDSFDERQAGTLPGILGIAVDAIADGSIDLSMAVDRRHLAPNGYLHAASVVALADTAAGYGCVVHLPDGATGFTTIELKSNFLGTALEGTIRARGTLAHAGRSTQIWDATVRGPDDRTIALFRCTQMILWPKR